MNQTSTTDTALSSTPSRQCPHCSQGYDDLIASSQPRVLHCLHTFCTNCCQTLAHHGTGKVIHCPLCSYRTELTENGIYGLDPNYAILKIIKLQKKIELMSQISTCDNCDVEVALWRCQNCDEGCANLCQECKSQHLQMKALRSHTFVTMEEYKQSNHLHSKDLFPCPKHPNEYLEVYCSDCHLAVCLTCAVYDHSQHCHRTVDDGLMIVQQQIQQEILDVVDVYQSYEVETNNITHIANNLNKQHEALKKNLSSLFGELQSQLHERYCPCLLVRARLILILSPPLSCPPFPCRRERVLLNELNGLHELKSQLLTQQISGLRRDIANARSSASYSNAILEHATPLQTILASQQIQTHLQHLSSSRLDTTPHSQADIIFETGTLPTITNLISGIGRLFDESTPIPSLCELSQVSVSVAPNHFWRTVFQLTIRRSNGDLLTTVGGIKPVVLVKMFDVQSPVQNGKKNREEVFETTPFSMSFKSGVWTIEVLSSKISGIVIEATLSGEAVQFSPLMATRGPEITLWGEDAGIILRSLPLHVLPPSPPPLPSPHPFPPSAQVNCLSLGKPHLLLRSRESPNQLRLIEMEELEDTKY
jgi:hypothetical protein